MKYNQDSTYPIMYVDVTHLTKKQVVIIAKMIEDRLNFYDEDGCSFVKIICRKDSMGNFDRYIKICQAEPSQLQRMDDYVHGILHCFEEFILERGCHNYNE